MWSPLWGGDIQWIEIRICSPSSSIFPLSWLQARGYGVDSSRSVRWMGSRGVSWIERGFAATCLWVADSLCLGRPVCLAFPQRTASHIGASYRWPRRQASSAERWAERRIGKPQALFEMLVEDPSGTVLLLHSFSFNNLGSFIFMKYLKDVSYRLSEMNRWDVSCTVSAKVLSCDGSNKSDKSNRSKQKVAEFFTKHLLGTQQRLMG